MAKTALGRGPGSKPQGSDVSQGSSVSPAELPTERSADGFRAVGHSAKVALDRPLQVGHGRESVVIFRTEQGLYAVSNVCNHEDGPVGEGQVKDCVVTCPYHDWRYDVRTGECLSHANRQLATFGVREEDGVLWLGPMLTEGATERGGAHDDGMEVLVRDLDEEP